MKNMKRLIYFSAVIMTCILGITCLSSCQNDDEENVYIVKAIIVEVDSTPCIVHIEWPEPYSITGMSIKEENSSIKGSLKGIGVQIGVRDSKLLIIAPIEDTPGEKAGLKAEDEILEIEKREREIQHREHLKYISQLERDRKLEYRKELKRPRPKARLNKDILIDSNICLEEHRRSSG